MYYLLSESDEKVETENEDEDETKERHMNQDELVKGAIESAFWAMDRLILRDKQQYRISGGACTMVALFIFDKLYLANAGDSRAVCYIPSVSFAWCILGLTNNLSDEIFKNIYKSLQCLCIYHRSVWSERCLSISLLRQTDNGFN